MSPRTRVILLVLAGLVILPGFWRVATALPGFGTAVSPYGQAVNALLPDMRHVSNMVSAINFDVRGFDTIGEEFMLLAAVAGTVLLLRGGRGEDRADRGGRIGGRAVVPRADAVVLIARICGPLTFIFGVYVALHAMATPGGGFQGGVIIASSLLLIYLGEGYGRWRQLAREHVLDAVEGGGAFLFVAAGLIPVAMGERFLTNVLPYGTIKDMLSGGLMLIENAGVALAVAGGFGTVLVEFMEETRATEEEIAEEGQGEAEGRP
jgi:multicomponent Na+:H+ antiporter subunit B